MSEALPIWKGDETSLKLPPLANVIQFTEIQLTHGFPGTLQVGWGRDHRTLGPCLSGFGRLGEDSGFS